MNVFDELNGRYGLSGKNDFALVAGSVSPEIAYSVSNSARRVFLFTFPEAESAMQNLPENVSIQYGNILTSGKQPTEGNPVDFIAIDIPDLIRAFQALERVSFLLSEAGRILLILGTRDRSPEEIKNLVQKLAPENSLRFTAFAVNNSTVYAILRKF